MRTGGREQMRGGRGQWGAGKDLNGGVHVTEGLLCVGPGAGALHASGGACSLLRQAQQD